MDFLQQVMDERRTAAETSRVPASTLERAARGRRHHSLIARLSRGKGTKIIAEVKKASPSAGVIVPKYAPDRIAKEYELAGAVAISVLTEPEYFKGSGAHLKKVRDAVNLPVLRKDFICTHRQILEAAAWGADVVLLIMAALDRLEVFDLYGYACELGLEVLVETHDECDMEPALDCKKAIVGVNSRNLKTLKTDLATAHALIRQIPDNRLAIAESGIKTREDIVSLERCGYDGFLVGESLLKSGDAGGKLKELMT